MYCGWCKTRHSRLNAACSMEVIKQRIIKLLTYFFPRNQLQYQHNCTSFRNETIIKLNELIKFPSQTTFQKKNPKHPTDASNLQQTLEINHTGHQFYIARGLYIRLNAQMHLLQKKINRSHLAAFSWSSFIWEQLFGDLAYLFQGKLV